MRFTHRLFGVSVVASAALPLLFRAVFGLSVPFQPRRPKGPPTAAMAAISKRLGIGDLYISRFQADDAHTVFDVDPATALRKAFYCYDGATPDVVGDVVEVRKASSAAKASAIARPGTICSRPPAVLIPRPSSRTRQRSPAGATVASL